MFLIIFMLPLLLCQAGCVPLPFPREYLKFRGLPEETQEENFRQFPLEKQLEYYKYCYLQKSCSTFFRSTIAAQGKAIVPYLLDRMNRSDETEKVRIAIIFWEMNKNHVRLDNDEELRKTLTDISCKMSDPVWKDLTISHLSEILGNNPCQFTSY